MNTRTDGGQVTAGRDRRPVLAGGRPLAELWLQVGPAVLALIVAAAASVKLTDTAPVWVLGGLVVAALVSALGLTAAIGALRRNWQAAHQQRAELEQRCAQALGDASDGVLSIDLAGRIVGVDARAPVLFGYTTEELSNLCLDDLLQFPAPEKDQATSSAGSLLPDFGTTLDATGITKTHKKLALKVISVPPPLADGSQVWLLLWDRTGLVEAKRKLARLEFIAEESPHPIVETDLTGQVTFLNASAERLFAGLRVEGAAHPLLKDLPVLVERLQTGRERSLIREVMVGRELFEQHIAYVPSSDTVRFFSFDVSDRREAFRDALTGLPNRASFTRRLNRVAALADGDSSYAFAVLFLDLDRFKVLNDTLGHATGDSLLRAVAQRLETCLRPNDLVARMGGDEFTILLDGVRDQAEAELITQRILDRLHGPFALERKTVFTSASVGIALSTVGYDEPLDLVAFADAAMYRAKTEGRARLVVFDAAVDGRAVPGRLF